MMNARWLLTAVLLLLLVPFAVLHAQDGPATPPPPADSDGDGLFDVVDQCVYAAGPESNGGCPLEATPDDTDGDGAIDRIDLCPDVASTDTFLGCPDTDVDGVADVLDVCPDVYGTSATDGCPPVLEVSLPDSLAVLSAQNAGMAQLVGWLRVEVNGMDMASNGLLAINTRWQVEVPYSNTSVREWRSQAVVYDLNQSTLAPILTLERTGRGFLSISADGHYLFTVTADRTLFRPTIEVWSLPDGELVQTINDQCQTIDHLLGMDANTDGSRVVLVYDQPPAQACRASQSTVEIFDVESGALVAELSELEPVLTAVYNERYLALATLNQTRLLNAIDHEPLLTLPQGVNEYENRPLAFSADGSQVAVANGLQATVYDTATGQVAFAVPPQTVPITTLAFSPDGSLLAVGTMRATVTLYDMATQTPVVEMNTMELMPHALAFSPDGRLLMYTHRNGAFMLGVAAE